MPRCEYCDEKMESPRKGQRFCSDACRAAGWRSEHLTRCPSCGVPIRVVVMADNDRSVRLSAVKI